MAGTDQHDENRQLCAAQQSYDASYHIYNFVDQAEKRTRLLKIFGMAAGLGSLFVMPQTLVPLILLNGAFIYETVANRAVSLKLSDMFNQIADMSEPDAGYHLQPIGDHLKNVDGIDLNELDPRRHYKNNPFDLALAGFALFFAPQLLPVPLASMVGKQDKDRFARIKQAAWEVGKEMDRLYPGQLTPPGQPREPS